MSVSTFTGEFGGPQPPRLQREKRPGPSLEARLIKIQAIGAGFMLAMGVSNLMTEVGALANAKAFLLAGTATIAAYAVNRFAVEKGAELASRGFKLATATSIFGILGVGTAMFSSTYSGLVLPDVAQRQLQEQGARLASDVTKRNDLVLQSGALGPVLQVISTEHKNVLKCEIESSCISHRREGGHGPVAKTLEPLAAKASSIVTQFEAGKIAAQKSLAALNGLLADYQKTLSRTDINVWQRQDELLKIQARMEQEASALVSALPVPLARAYAAELATGISIADRPAASAQINSLRAKQAETINTVLASIGNVQGAPPTFPGRAGVLDALRYLLEFSSIAAIVFVAEMVLPLTIWLYAFLSLRWVIEQQEQIVKMIELEPLFAPPPASPALPAQPNVQTAPLEPPPAGPALPAPVNEANPVDAPRRRGRPPGKRDA